MLIFAYVVLIVYLLAVNFYGVLMLNFQKKEKETECQSTISDWLLFFAGLVGGALGIFITMFVLKYKLKNMLLMIFMPVFASITIFLVVIMIINRFYIV